jgi:hypothetical protein
MCMGQAQQSLLLHVLLRVHTFFGVTLAWQGRVEDLVRTLWRISCKFWPEPPHDVHTTIVANTALNLWPRTGYAYAQLWLTLSV